MKGYLLKEHAFVAGEEIFLESSSSENNYAVVFEEVPHGLRGLRAGSSGLYRHGQDAGTDTAADAGGSRYAP